MQEEWKYHPDWLKVYKKSPGLARWWRLGDSLYYFGLLGGIMGGIAGVVLPLVLMGEGKPIGWWMPFVAGPSALAAGAAVLILGYKIRTRAELKAAQLPTADESQAS